MNVCKHNKEMLEINLEISLKIYVTHSSYLNLRCSFESFATPRIWYPFMIVCKLQTTTHKYMCSTSKGKWQANEQQMSASVKLELKTKERWRRKAVKQRRSEALRQSNRCTIFYHFSHLHEFSHSHTMSFDLSCEYHSVIAFFYLVLHRFWNKMN